MQKLKVNYVGFLRDAEGREAFRLLERDAWDRDHAAMVNSDIPLVLDVLNLTANVHNKGEIIVLWKMLAERDRKIGELEERLKMLEGKQGM